MVKDKLFEMQYSQAGVNRIAFFQAPDEQEAIKGFKCALKQTDKKGRIKIINCRAY